MHIIIVVKNVHLSQEKIELRLNVLIVVKSLALLQKDLDYQNLVFIFAVLNVKIIMVCLKVQKKNYQLLILNVA